MLRHTGMYCPNGLLFYHKDVEMYPILVKKSVEEGSISKQLQKKKVKSAVFEVEKPLEVGPDLLKFRKNSQISCISREKNLYIWIGISDLILHTLSKNNSSTLPPAGHCSSV